MSRAFFKPGDSNKSALQLAFKLLGYRGRSEREMIEKLSTKGFDENDIRKTVIYLKENDLLDDRKLASSLKRYAAESKHLGIQGTKRFLMERGVPIEIVNDTVRGIDESEIAVRLIEKKLKNLKKEPSDIKIKKLYGILLRRGYSYETIRKTLRQFQLTENA